MISPQHPSLSPSDPVAAQDRAAPSASSAWGAPSFGDMYDRARLAAGFPANPPHPYGREVTVSVAPKERDGPDVARDSASRPRVPQQLRGLRDAQYSVRNSDDSGYSADRPNRTTTKNQPSRDSDTDDSHDPDERHNSGTARDETDAPGDAVTAATIAATAAARSITPARTEAPGHSAAAGRKASGQSTSSLVPSTASPVHPTANAGAPLSGRALIDPRIAQLGAPVVSTVQPDAAQIDDEADGIAPTSEGSGDAGIVSAAGLDSAAGKGAIRLAGVTGLSGAAGPLESKVDQDSLPTSLPDSKPSAVVDDDLALNPAAGPTARITLPDPRLADSHAGIAHLASEQPARNGAPSITSSGPLATPALAGAEIAGASSAAGDRPGGERRGDGEEGSARNRSSEALKGAVTSPPAGYRSLQESVVSASPPPEPPSIDRNQLVQQISRHIESMRVASGHGEMTLHLSPDHLGSLRLTVATDANGIAARIVVETAQAHQSVESAREHLRSALESKGLNLASLDVALNQNASGNGSGQSGRSLQEQSASRAPGPRPEGALPDTSTPGAPTSIAPMGDSRYRLDYRA